jgi:hypothetical protein
MPDSAQLETLAASGLEGVVVASTALSHVDGARGQLIIRIRR